MSAVGLLEHLGLPNHFPAFFPSKLERYRRSLSEATDAPDEYAVAYMLAAGATAVGANVAACVQNGWCVRSNLFVAVIGHKGSGKSTLADKVFEPLLRHEENLREAIASEVTSDEDEDEVAEDEERVGRQQTQVVQPCVIVNDCTGPAVLRLLEHNQRQLLVNPDELSSQFIRNTGGTDRQMWCELYDGRRRRRERASSGSRSTTLASPYVSVLGGIQPDLFRCAYGKRGDDGLLDRLLLVGDGVARPANWPRNADDTKLNAEWASAVDRMLHIEELASDSLGVQVESRFTHDAIDVCRDFEKRLNQLVSVIGVPESQFGIVAKLRQHTVKLALLHRCFRWAAGEFGERDDFGDVDADDAKAACDATLFFLGRWLIWRPELWPTDAAPASSATGLAYGAGNDPALRELEAESAAAQSGVRVIERLVRFLRGRGPEPVSVSFLATASPLATESREDLQATCDWLVARGHAESVADGEAIRMNPLPKHGSAPSRRDRRRAVTH
jgi:hypothetical protein